MRLVVDRAIIDKIAFALRPARDREIGGLLFGEHVEGDLFRLVDVSVQTTGGTSVHFVRDPDHHAPAIEAFFKKTGYDYARFNYLGEWHSHPSFEALPSRDDVHTMQSIVADPNVGANFAILVIVRLHTRRRIELSATYFGSSGDMSAVEVAVDGEQRKSWIQQALKAIVAAPKTKPAGRRVV